MGCSLSKPAEGKQLPPPWSTAAMDNLLSLLLELMEIRAGLESRESKAAGRKKNKKILTTLRHSQGSMSEQAIAALSEDSKSVPTVTASQPQGGSGAARRRRRSSRGRAGRRKRERRRMRRKAELRKKCRMRRRKTKKPLGTEIPPAAKEVISQVPTKWAIAYDQPAGQAFMENHLQTAVHVEPQDQGLPISKLKEVVIGSEKCIKLDIDFPHKSVQVDTEDNSTLQDVLYKIESPICDAYYTCEQRIVDENKSFSDTNVCNGSKIVVHPRLRGGSGAPESSNSSQLQGGSSETVNSQVRKIPFKEYMDDQKKKKDWLEIVQIPEHLKVCGQFDKLVVCLGKSGRVPLGLFLECMERKWKRNKTLRGYFSEDNLFYNPESGAIEIDSEEFELDHLGFRSDCSQIQKTLRNNFTYWQNKVTQFPMYLLGLLHELDEAKKEENGYLNDEEKRSLIHNNAVTMSFERRIQITTSVIRYSKTLDGANRARLENSFQDIGADGKRKKIFQWTNLIPMSSKILFDRLWHNRIGCRKHRYDNTIFSFWEFSRCVYEHGPTLNVSEKQCEAALYQINNHLFQHVQRQIITVYKEVQPVPQVPPQAPAQLQLGQAQVPPQAPAQLQLGQAQVPPQAPAQLQLGQAQVPPQAPAQLQLGQAQVPPQAPAQLQLGQAQVPPAAVGKFIPPGRRKQSPQPGAANVQNVVPAQAHPLVPAQAHSLVPAPNPPRRSQHDATSIPVSNRFNIKEVYSKY